MLQAEINILLYITGIHMPFGHLNNMTCVSSLFSVVVSSIPGTWLTITSVALWYVVPSELHAAAEVFDQSLNLTDQQDVYDWLHSGRQLKVIYCEKRDNYPLYEIIQVKTQKITRDV